jgi:hypothetical protein
MSYKFQTAAGTGTETFDSDLPLPQFPTTPPEDELSKTYNTEHHLRHGIIMGSIDYGAKRLWVLEWQFISGSDVANLQAWADLRVWKFSTDSGSNYTTVRMVEKDFKPTNQRGGYYGVKMTLEEV